MTRTSPSPRAARALSLVLLAVALIGLGSGPVAARQGATPAAGTPATATGDGDTDPALYANVAPDLRDGIEAGTAGDLSRYAIDLAITPATGTDLTGLAGTVDLLFVNPTDDLLDTVWFRLYANDPRYGDGGIAMTDVEVAGDPVTPDLSDGQTTVEVPLGLTLAPGEAVTITYAFDGEVANDPAGSYGMFTNSLQSGTLALAHWYPILAGLDADQQWNLEPVSVNGDPIFSNTSLYEVAIEIPTAWRLVTSGTEVDTSSADGLTTHRYVTGPSRDVTVVADESFEVLTADLDGITVRSWYDTGDEAGARAVLDAGVRTLELYQPRLGVYPYVEMDLVEVSVGNGAAGIEFPQLLFIGGDYYVEQPVAPPDVSYLESLVVHEVLHQWFYGLVGNDQYAAGFLDEGIVNYLMTFYFELAYGPEEGEVAYLSANLIPYLGYLFGYGDVVVDFPTDDYPSSSDYVTAAYYKGAVAFDAVRSAIGDDAFFDALGAYVADYRFAVATPADLLAAFEAASGEDLGDLWANWFESANGAEDFSQDDLADAQARLDALLGRP